MVMGRFQLSLMQYHQNTKVIKFAFSNLHFLVRKCSTICKALLGMAGGLSSPLHSPLLGSSNIVVYYCVSWVKGMLRINLRGGLCIGGFLHYQTKLDEKRSSGCIYISNDIVQREWHPCILQTNSLLLLFLGFSRNESPRLSEVREGHFCLVKAHGREKN